MALHSVSLLTSLQCVHEGDFSQMTPCKNDCESVTNYDFNHTVLAKYSATDPELRPAAVRDHPPQTGRQEDVQVRTRPHMHPAGSYPLQRELWISFLITTYIQKYSTTTIKITFLHVFMNTMFYKSGYE